MKILKISDVYFPRVNGVSTSLATFRGELERMGHEVTLVAPAYNGHDSAPGVARVASRRIAFDREDRMMKARRTFDTAQALDPVRFDIIHIHTPFVAHHVGMKLARGFGLPVVETFHTFFEAYLQHYVPFLPATVLRWTARRFSGTQCNEVDAVIVPSTALRDVLERYGVRSRIEVIPTGIPLAEFRHGDGAVFRRRHGIAPNRPTLVHVGRIAFEKNIAFLLEALREVKRAVPEVLLLVVGEGPAEPALRRRAAALGRGENVLHLPYLPRNGELQGCFRAGDAFVFASRTETQGLVLLEAMALGVPVVSTAVLGTRDILAARRGALVAEDSVADFAAKVVRVLAQPELRRHLGQEAAAHAEEWSARAMAERMVALYEDLASEHRRRRGAGEPRTPPGC